VAYAPEPRAKDLFAEMQRVFRVVRLGLVFEGLYIGLGYIFGPARWFTTNSYEVLQQVAPIWVWGILITSHSLMLLDLRTRWYGYAAGAAVWFLVALVFLLSVPVTNGWGGPATFGFTALMHWVGAKFVGSPVRFRARVLRKWLG
jgi:hypothetical protein